MKRILVTGAGGFVCSSFIPTLLARGYAVTAVDRAFDEALLDEWRTWGEQLQVIEGDMEQLPSIEVDALIHGAAVTASPEEIGQTPEENLRANIEPLLAVSAWVAKHGVRRAIYFSSGAVYSSTEGATTEDVPPTPLGLYAVAKQTMEAFIETLRDVYGRDAVVLRLSNIYGLHEQARPTRPRMSLVGRMLDEALRTGTIAAYQNSLARDWTFAPDLGKVIDCLLQTPALKHAVYNAAAEHLLTQLDVARGIQAALPNVTIDLQDGGDPAESKITRRGYLSSQRLREETGFNDWTAFADAIKQIIAAHHARSEKVVS